MKKMLMIVAAAASMIASADADGYFMCSAIAPGQLPEPITSSIYGARLNFIWGNCRELRGLDVGFSGTLMEDMYGLQLGAFYIVEREMMGSQISFVNSAGDAYGLQFGLLNFAERTAGVQLGILGDYSKEFSGVQLGLVNYTENFSGVQLGLWNQTKKASGVQVGLVNIISDSPIFVCPFVNLYF